MSPTDGDRITALLEIAQGISQYLDIDDLFASITLHLRDVFDFRRASITLREGARPHARVMILDQRWGQEVTTDRISPLEDLAFDQIVRLGQPYRLVSNLADTCEFEDEARLLADGLRAYVCLPLTMWGQVLGAFSLASEQPGAFTPSDLDFLQRLARQIGGGVWNALLYEVEQQRRHLADALARLSQIVNSTLDLNEVFELALQQLARVITYDSAAILLQEGTDMRIAAAQGFERPDLLVGATFRLEENNIAHQTMRAQRARVVADVQQLAEWGHTRDDVEGAHTIRAWIGAPLLVRHQSIGILTVNSFTPGFYTDEDGETVTAFAAQIATAIHNARLYQAVQEQRNRLAAILTDTTDAVIVLDQDHLLWLINPAAERYLKVRREQVLGRPLSELGVPELITAFTKAAAGGQPTMSEITGLDGAAFNASLAPVHEVGWVIVMQDITPLKELDRLRTEWVAAVSHDLKNPIQVMQLGAALLEMDGPLNEMQMERVMIIQRSATQLSNLVAGVLDLARLEAGPSLRPTPLVPVDLCISVMQEVQHLAAQREQQLVLDVPDHLPLLMGDAALLQRALSNLVGNAIKYTPQGGTITIRARAQDTALELTVSDTGPGIPADALAHLFDRFYRVPGTKADGTGLGLSIVKTIVEKHGGSVAVSSAPGQGSTFTITLPV